MTFYTKKRLYLSFENNTGRTDRPTDGRTDTPSYRDARTHLKTSAVLFQSNFPREGRVPKSLAYFNHYPHKADERKLAL